MNFTRIHGCMHACIVYIFGRECFQSYGGGMNTLVAERPLFIGTWTNISWNSSKSNPFFPSSFLIGFWDLLSFQIFITKTTPIFNPFHSLQLLLLHISEKNEGMFCHDFQSRCHLYVVMISNLHHVWLQFFGWMQNKLNGKQGTSKSNTISATCKHCFCFHFCLN